MSEDLSIAAGQLRAYVERIERIEAEIAEANADKSEVYKEARGDGFDVKTIRKVVAKRKIEEADRDEQDSLFDLYWSALHVTPSRVHVHVREEPSPPKAAEAVSERTAINHACAPDQSADAIAGAVERRISEAAPQSDREDAGVTAGETATDLPETATRGLDDLGSVQDGLEMSTDGQRAETLSISDCERPQQGGVTAGETAAFSQRKPYALRPNCQDRENCGGYGAKHCHKCTVAASLAEEAA